VRTVKFADWLEIASRDKTAGWITPGDLWIADDGAAHLVWTERALDERLREKFFPAEKQSYELNYAVVRGGKIVRRRTLLAGGANGEVPGRARLQATPEGRLIVFHYVSGRDAAGNAVSENRVMELRADGTATAPVRVPLKHPLSDYFTATPRGGSSPSRTLELLGHRVDSSSTVSYARIRLW